MLETPIGNGVWVGILGPSLVFLAKWAADHRKGKARDNAGAQRDQARLSSLDRIETKIDEHQRENRETFQRFDVRLTEVAHVADSALSHAIGPDGKNGFRSRIEILERRVGEEDRRHRDRAAEA